RQTEGERSTRAAGRKEMRLKVGGARQAACGEAVTKRQIAPCVLIDEDVDSRIPRRADEADSEPRHRGEAKDQPVRACEPATRHAPAPCSVLRRRRLNEPRLAASKHQDLGAGSEEVESDGAPDAPRLWRPT